MTKEEMLMQAIGMLPEEMAVQKETDELKKDARNLERKVMLYKSRYILAAAACLLLIITAASINKNHNRNMEDKVKDASINSSSPDKNKEDGKKNSINCFVITDTADKADKGNTEVCQDGDNEYNNSFQPTDLKKVLQGRTVKLQTVQDIQSSSSSKKKATAEYIVYSFDKDCYITISGHSETGMAYIMDKESGRKHYIKGEKEFCKTGNHIYFDISVAKMGSSCKEDIKGWNKKGIKVTAYTDIYQEKDGNMEKTGVFYIGVKQNNKERKIYYGKFENEN